MIKLILNAYAISMTICTFNKNPDAFSSEKDKLVNYQ